MSKAAEQCRTRLVTIVNVDATGVGAGTSPHLQRNKIAANPVKVASSPTEKTELGEFLIPDDCLAVSALSELPSNITDLKLSDHPIISALAAAVKYLADVPYVAPSDVVHMAEMDDDVLGDY